MNSKPPGRTHAAVPEAAPTLRDYPRLAQAQLDPAIWRYLMEGDATKDGEATHNAGALRHCALVPRPLRSVAGGHTRCTLFGHALAHPLLLAPIAYQRLFHPDGEMASAMAAAAHGAPMLISSLASQALPAIAAAAQTDNAGGAWFQLYWQGQREATLRLLRRAEDAGCSAIVFTVDAPVKVAGLVLPPDVRAVNLEMPAHPPCAPHEPAKNACHSAVFDGWMAHAPTWDDVRWLRQHTNRPLLIKGILHPDDAAQSLDAGCDGLVVSNHGGRVLHNTPASLHALHAIAARVQGRVPVLFDSGIRSGRDVQVALAHGASAVLIGRPAIWGLAARGAMGVAHVLRLLRDELEMTMALTGCKTLAAIGPDCLSLIGSDDSRPAPFQHAR